MNRFLDLQKNKFTFDIAGLHVVEYYLYIAIEFFLRFLVIKFYETMLEFNCDFLFVFILLGVCSKLDDFTNNSLCTNSTVRGNI